MADLKRFAAQTDNWQPKHFITQSATQAKLGGVSRSTIHRWVKAGTLTAYRVGPRLLRFDPDEVEAMVRAAQVGGAQ